MVRNTGESEWMPSKCDRVKVMPGDTLYFNTWGGGGWGDPLEREPETVALDVQRRLVSPDGARRYGVVMTSDNSVDTTGTEKLRREMSLSRGDIPLFNFGGTVQELKDRCLSDTHLNPPTKPVFQKWMTLSAHNAKA